MYLEMFLLKICYLLLIISSNQIKCDEVDPEADEKVEPSKICRERNRKISNDKEDKFNIAEGCMGETIKLQCHFCGEQDDGHPKNWFVMDPLDDQIQNEVQLDMNNNMSLNRVHVNTEHTLTIHNMTAKDRGEYFCKGFEGDEVDHKYNFLLDIVIPTEIPPEEGNISFWRKYHDEQYVPINHLFNSSNGTEFKMLHEKLKVHLEVETEWEPEGPCEICGRPKGAGKKYQKGHCRIKINRIGTPETSLMNNHAIKMLMRAKHLSCRSITLNELIPGIINRTVIIPDFTRVETCEGICNPDAEGVYSGWKTRKTTGFKYKKTFVLAENAHLTLICPESTLENRVVWKINNQVIKAGEIVVPPSNKIEPRVTVDSFNTLYLYGVTKEQEGNYTCYVDKVRMQQVRVFVVSKARLLTQAFFRHMMYLAFVLSLTLSCYCAGLVVTWSRRHKFKSYKEVRHLLKKNHQLLDDDLSEITISNVSLFEEITTNSISAFRVTSHGNETKDSSEDRRYDDVEDEPYDDQTEESPLMSNEKKIVSNELKKVSKNSYSYELSRSLRFKDSLKPSELTPTEPDETTSSTEDFL